MFRIDIETLANVQRNRRGGSSSKCWIGLISSGFEVSVNGKRYLRPLEYYTPRKYVSEEFSIFHISSLTAANRATLRNPGRNEVLFVHLYKA